MRNLSDLRIKLFADGATKAGILRAHDNPLIRWFTTNPTSMRAAGVTDYEAFARDILDLVTDDVGCHTTATENLLAKLEAVGKDLQDFSLETVLMFHADAARSVYRL